MSRYVTHKHGLVVGSDNVFFIVGEDEPAREHDYRAILSFDSYGLKQISSLNARLRTPAQQLVWRALGEHHLGYAIGFVLTGWAQRWLTENVGKIRDDWDVRTVCELSDQKIFFKRRKDALAFVRAVAEVLDGVPTKVSA